MQFAQHVVVDVLVIINQA